MTSDNKQPHEPANSREPHAQESNASRRTLKIGELPRSIVADLEKSKMSERHGHLDELME